MKRVCLVRPQGPRNVGSVLRAVANFGPAELFVVGPVRPALLRHPDFTQMSHGVEDVAARVQVVARLPEALADCTGSYGFTARGRDHRSLRDWREVVPELVRRAADPSERIALVFGSEENGLTGAETDPLHELCRMPTSEEHGSLNLATTVAICLSTLFFAEAPSAALEGSTRLRDDDRAFLVATLKAVLGSCTTSAPARRDLEASVERVFARAPLESRDARAWHLLARALGSDRTPGDFGLAGRPRNRVRYPRPRKDRGARAGEEGRERADRPSGGGPRPA